MFMSMADQIVDVNELLEKSIVKIEPVEGTMTTRFYDTDNSYILKCERCERTNIQVESKQEEREGNIHFDFRIICPEHGLNSQFTLNFGPPRSE